MDTTQQINQYEHIIIDFLTAQQTEPLHAEGYRKEMVVDRERKHYQLLATGWVTANRYVDTLLIHLRIKPDNKVWLLENNTELHVAEELVKRGVAPTDIVLGFHPPTYRTFTGYAAA